MPSPHATALLIDPHSRIEPGLGRLLSARRWHCLTVDDELSARRVISQQDLSAAFLPVEVVSSDLASSIAAITNVQPQLPIIVLSRRPSAALTEQAVAAGAFDIIDPEPAESRLIPLLARILEHLHLKRSLIDSGIIPPRSGHSASQPARPDTGKGIVPIRVLERRAIEHALSVCGSVAQAARRLGISEATIYRKIKRYQLRAL